jgi:hypothetical protein
MLHAVVLLTSMPKRGRVTSIGSAIRIEWRFGVQRREASARFVTGRNGVRMSGRRICSTVTAWRKRGQLIEVEIDGLTSHGCTGSVRS